MSKDEIIIDSSQCKTILVPSEPASDPNFIKHVHCEGARFHVLAYDSIGISCSEKRCIINKRYEEDRKRKQDKIWN